MWWWTDECSLQEKLPHSISDSSAHSASGKAGQPWDRNSRLSGFPPMRQNKNHAWNCLVTNDVIRKDRNCFTRSYPALPVDKSPRRYLFKTATYFRPASERTWQARTKKQLKGHKANPCLRVIVHIKRDKSSRTSSSSANWPKLNSQNNQTTET